MKVESDYIGMSFELSKPVVKMAWGDAIQQEWPDGWRMPTRAELVTVFDEATSSGHDFADTSIVCSASSYTPAPTYAWVVYFGDGASASFDKADWLTVRLVREVSE